MPGRSGSIRLIEAKATHTVKPAMAAPMQRLASAMGAKRRKRVEMLVVHLEPRAGTRSQALSPGVRAVAWPDFVASELA